MFKNLDDRAMLEVYYKALEHDLGKILSLS